MLKIVSYYYDFMKGGILMEQIIVNKKDDIVVRMLHYFVTEENYKPIILNGVKNEIWLENFDKDLKLIRININYIHNEEQFTNDLWKADMIRKNIAKKTLSFKTQMLNILIDTNEDVKVSDIKGIASLKINKIGDIKKNKLLNEFFPMLKNVLKSKEKGFDEFVKLTTEMNEKTIKEEKKMDSIFKKKNVLMTNILIAINIIVFVAMYAVSIVKPGFYNMINYYGANNYALIQSEGFFGLYRLITSTFIHAGLFHIFFNMYALYIVGAQVERYYGKIKFLGIYFISGIVGGLFSNVFMGATSISIGASGAIFGLFGALAYFAYNYRALLGGFLKSSIIPVIVINLLLGFIIPGIDVFAHIGGLLGGLLVSIGLGAAGKEKNKTSINFIIVLFLIIAFMIYMIYTK